MRAAMSKIAARLGLENHRVDRVWGPRATHDVPMGMEAFLRAVRHHAQRIHVPGAVTGLPEMICYRR